VKRKKPLEAVESIAESAVKDAYDRLEPSLHGAGRVALEAYEQQLQPRLKEAKKRGAKLAAETLDRVHPALDGALDKVTPAVDTAINRVRPALDETLQRVAPSVDLARGRVQNDFLPWLVATLYQAAELVKEELPPEPKRRSVGKTVGLLALAGAVLAGVVFAVRKLLGSSDSGWETHEPSRPFVADPVADVVGKVKDAAADVADDVKRAAGKAKDAAADAVDDLKKAAGKTGDAAGDALGDAKKATAAVVDDAKDASGDALEAAGDAIDDAKKAAADVVDDVKDASADAADKAQDTASDVAGDVQDAASDAADKAQDAASDAADAVEYKSAEVSDDVQDAGWDAQDRAKDATKGGKGDASPLAESPYGEGSYVGAEPPEGFDIKGNERSMKYHLQSSGGYERTITDVWFNSAEAAESAGFVRAQR